MKFTVNSHEDFARAYPLHRWGVDIDVYIYDSSTLSDAEIDEIFAGVEKSLRGDYAIFYDGSGDGRGFSFFAEDARPGLLFPLLRKLEYNGCIVEWNGED